MATTANLIRPRQDDRPRPDRRVPQDAAWWRDEVGIEVEHEVWHLPQLAEEEQQAQV
jgi:hypothetical protein